MGAFPHGMLACSSTERTAYDVCWLPMLGVGGRCWILVCSRTGLRVVPGQMLMDYLGLEKVIWLWRGMEGDMEVVNGALPC